MMLREHLYQKETAEDWKAQLAESWSSYAIRTGKGAAAADEEHVKHSDENWEQYEQRKVRQNADLTAKLRLREAAEQAEEREKKQRQLASAEAIAKVMAAEQKTAQLRTKARNWLYVDFDAYQQDLFLSRRNDLSDQEQEARTAIFAELDCATDSLSIQGAANKAAHQQAEVERKERELQLLRETEAAREREILAQKEREKQLKLEEETAERQRKEQIELEKRAERKKREEEKRVKARAERERAKQAAAAGESKTGADAAGAADVQDQDMDDEIDHANV